MIRILSKRHSRNIKITMRVTKVFIKLMDMEYIKEGVIQNQKQGNIFVYERLKLKLNTHQYPQTCNSE